MTRRKNPEALVKITLNVNARDYARMKALYPRVGATVAIRALISAHVTKVEAKAAAAIDTSAIDDLDIEL